MSRQPAFDLDRKHFSTAVQDAKKEVRLRNSAFIRASRELSTAEKRVGSEAKAVQKEGLLPEDYPESFWDAQDRAYRAYVKEGQARTLRRTAFQNLADAKKARKKCQETSQDGAIALPL